MTSHTSRSGGNSFFTWVRGLGVARQDAWFGGVCGGLAARWGIDPLIVRGVAVVGSLIGLPFVLLYGLAWFLLPDERDDNIHAESMFSGAVAPVQFGVLAVAVIGLTPFASGFGWVFGYGALGVVPSFNWVGLALIVGGAVLIGWLIARVVNSRATSRAAAKARSGRDESSESGVAPASNAAAESDAGGQPTAGRTLVEAGTATQRARVHNAQSQSAPAQGAPASNTEDGNAADGNAEKPLTHEAQRADDGTPDAAQEPLSARESRTAAAEDAAHARRAAAEERRAYLNEVRAQRRVEAEQRRDERNQRNRKLPAAGSWLILGVSLLAGVATFAIIRLTGAAEADALLPAISVQLGVLGLGILIAALVRRRTLLLGWLAIPIAGVLAVSLLIPAPSYWQYGVSVPNDLMVSERHLFGGTERLILDSRLGASEQTYEFNTGLVLVSLVGGARVRVVGALDSGAVSYHRDGQDDLVVPLYGDESVAQTFGAGDGPVSTIQLTGTNGFIFIDDETASPESLGDSESLGTPESLGAPVATGHFVRGGAAA